jgi:hypothetical protein
VRHLQREWGTSVQPLKKPTVPTVLAHASSWTKKAANIIKPLQTSIYWKKYVNGSENLKGHQKNKNTTCDTYSDLDLSIYVIKNPIQLVRQSL